MYSELSFHHGNTAVLMWCLVLEHCHWWWDESCVVLPHLGGLQGKMSALRGADRGIWGDVWCYG